MFKHILRLCLVFSLKSCWLFLEQQNCADHLAIDGWTSPMTSSYLGVVVIWYDAGKIYHEILEFIRYVLQSQTSKSLSYQGDPGWPRVITVNILLWTWWLREFNIMICLHFPDFNHILVKQLATTSPTNFEQAFFEGHRKVNFIQHNTTSQTFKAEMAVGSWDGTPLFPEIDAAIWIMEKKLNQHAI